MNPSAINHRAWWSFFLACLFLLALQIRHNVASLDHEVRREGLSSQAVSACRSVLIDMVDAETGIRGYLVIDRDDYLQPYHEAIGRARGDVSRLVATIGWDGVEGPMARRVVELSADVFAVFRAVIEESESKGIDAGRALFAARPTKPAMDQLRDQLGRIQAEEDSRLARNLASLDAQMRVTFWAIDGFMAVLVVLLVAMATGMLAPTTARP